MQVSRRPPPPTPSRRPASVQHRRQRAFVSRLGGWFAPILAEYRDAFVDEEYVSEMRGIARTLDVREEDVVIANLYYDALKFVLGGSIGCTEFAVDTPDGPLHARNLDWTSANGRLSSETIIANFRRGTRNPFYRIITWPGFVGCLSGVAPGRFAVTLNAVLSDDAPELAAPISFVLRRALETAETFDAAVAMLRDTAVASDSLLLVSGPQNGQTAVVERAPTRATLRGPIRGVVVVTNDYRAPATAEGVANLHGPLRSTSCGRYDCAEQMIRHAPPRNASSCMTVLEDPGVKMAITVQHLVLSARTGAVDVELPG
jgi:acid ceramidase